MKNIYPKRSLGLHGLHAIFEEIKNQANHPFWKNQGMFLQPLRGLRAGRVPAASSEVSSWLPCFLVTSLMEEIPNNHPGMVIKPYKLVGESSSLVLGGAGFCPSTVLQSYSEVYDVLVAM